MYDRYWDDYQANNDPMWKDEDKEQDDEAFYNYVDQLIDEKLLERKGCNEPQF